MFSRAAVIENLQCGLFRTEDTYWSDNLQKWRSLPELENDVELTMGSFGLKGNGSAEAN